MSGCLDQVSTLVSTARLDAENHFNPRANTARMTAVTTSAGRPYPKVRSLMKSSAEQAAATAHEAIAGARSRSASQAVAATVIPKGPE